MNDPIIHAKASKIVEAINNSLNTMSLPYTKSQTLKLVTEALASLSGDKDWTNLCECSESDKHGETWCCNHCGLPTSNHTHPSERENEFPKAKDYGYHSSENRTGKAFERGYRIGYATAKSSEREVLDGFVTHIKKYRGTEYELNIDLYLSEKQSKTEKK